MPSADLSELPTLVPIIWPSRPGKQADLPRFLLKSTAGVPSPTVDYVESGLDLNDYLVEHRASTFMFDVCGDSMQNAGIFDGDKIVVDRVVHARDGNIVVVVLNGEHTVKRLHAVNGGIELRAENPRYRPIRIDDGMKLDVFGVVVGVVRNLRP